MKLSFADYMIISFSIVHPAHFHMYKSLITKLSKDGHTIDIVAVKKDVNIDLLEKSGFSYKVIGEKSGNPFFDLIKISVRLLKHYKHLKPDIVIDRGLCNVACKLLKIPNVEFDDDGLFIQRLYLSFSTIIITPIGTNKKYLFSKHIEQKIMKELMYLNPEVFVPNSADIVGIFIKPYILIRWVSLDAHHDHNVKGLTKEIIIKLISIFNKDFDFFISFEGKLPIELEPYNNPLPPERMHDFMSFASLLITDSQTTAKESALVGTPVIRYNSFVGDEDFPVFQEIEKKYGILYNAISEQDIIENARRFLDDDRDWNAISNSISKDYDDLNVLIYGLIMKYNDVE